jgi:hypothetical protein
MKNTLLLAGFVLLLMTIGCEKNSDNQETGKLSIKLTDAPFPIKIIEEANVTINKIEIREKGDGTDDGSTYSILSEVEQSFNLLDLTNGVTVSLAELDIPVGKYDLIRLYVSSTSIKLTNGWDFDLTIPSGSQSGIKIFIDPELEVVGGLSSELLLDFNVYKSFAAQGNTDTPSGIHGFHFKPVIRVSNTSTAGRITGSVIDSLSAVAPNVLLSVIDADTILSSTFSDTITGYYALIGLPEGTYDLKVEKEGYDTDTIIGIDVIAGNNTVKDIQLLP